MRTYRLGRSALWAAAATLSVGWLGYPWAALGVWIGLGLHIGNLLLLHEVARSLLAARSGRAGRSLAAVSSLGRLTLLGVLLAATALALGREALLGACGGLFLAQVNLALPTTRSTEAV